MFLSCFSVCFLALVEDFPHLCGLQKIGFATPKRDSQSNRLLVFFFLSRLRSPGFFFFFSFFLLFICSPFSVFWTFFHVPIFFCQKKTFPFFPFFIISFLFHFTKFFFFAHFSFLFHLFFSCLSHFFFIIFFSFCSFLLGGATCAS